MNCFKCNTKIELSNFGKSYFYLDCGTCKIVYWIGYHTGRLEYINFKNLNLRFALENSNIIVNSNYNFTEINIKCEDDVSFFEACQKYIDNLIFI